MHNDKLRIAFVVPGWPISSFPNGVVSYLKNLTSGLEECNDVLIEILAFQTASKKNHNRIISLTDLSNIDIKPNLKNKIETIVWSRINNAKLIQKKTATKIVAGIKSLQNNINLLEIEECYGRGLLIANNINQPIITRLHGPWFIHGPLMKKENDNGYKYRVKAEGLAIGTSHGVSAPSLDVLNKVREFYDLELPDAEVIPNPVPVMPDGYNWRGIKINSNTILFIGRFDLHKGGDLVIDAFRIIAQKNRDIKLIFVGPDRGIPIDGKIMFFEEYVDSFIPEEHVKKRIEFLGHCGDKQIAQLRQDSLVTVIASRYETFCISLVEALATGCPVVATAAGAINEIITDEFNGLLAEPGSAESICEKVLMLFENPELMTKLSKNGIASCKANYSPVFIAKKSLAFYKTVINR